MVVCQLTNIYMLKVENHDTSMENILYKIFVKGAKCNKREERMYHSVKLATSRTPKLRLNNLTD